MSKKQELCGAFNDNRPSEDAISLQVHQPDCASIQPSEYPTLIRDNMLQFVGLLDNQGNILEVNTPSLEGAGVTIEEVYMKPFWETRWWEGSPDKYRVRAACEQCARTGKCTRFDTHIWGADRGTAIISIDFSIRPAYRNGGNQPVAMLIEARDITEMKKVEAAVISKNAELTALYSKLKKLDSMKSLMFTNVSHELRTPLTLIVGPLERLLTLVDIEIQDTPSSQQPKQTHKRLAEPYRLIKQDLEIVWKNANTLLKLVNDLLDVAKLESGKTPLNYRRTNLNALVRHIASHFDALIKERDINFTITEKVDPDGVTDGYQSADIDSDKVERCVLNLLGNAFKFTPVGGSISLTIARSTTAEATAITPTCISPTGLTHQHVEITVEDSGPGIPPERYDDIFERFMQVDGGNTRRFGGTGLGLAIVKNLMELHHGAVFVSKSEALGGASFTLRIPQCSHPNEQPQSPAATTPISNDTTNSNNSDSINTAELAEGGDIERVSSSDKQQQTVYAMNEELAPPFLFVDMKRVAVVDLKTTLDQANAANAQFNVEEEEEDDIIPDFIDDEVPSNPQQQHQKQQKNYYTCNSALTQSTEAEQQPGSTLPEKPLVLIVEDNVQMNNFLCETILCSGWYRVMSALNGRIGLEKAMKYQPDIIVTDIMMPEMSGEELVYEIRQKQQQPQYRALSDVPIVLLSAKADNKLRIKLLQSGANDYVVKPFHAQELLARLHNLVKIQRVRKILRAELDSRNHDVEDLSMLISEKKHELQNALREAKEASVVAEHLNRLKDEFLATVSHELRTPLTAIIGWSQLLSDSNPKELDPVDLQHGLETIDSCAKAQLHIVEDLLDVSRIISAKMSFNLQSVVLADVVEASVRSLSLAVKAKNLNLTVTHVNESQSNTNWCVVGDSQRLQQVMWNLLSNAIKFTPENGNISVTVTQHRDDDIAEISVVDNGIGWSAEEAGKLFTRFGQLNSSNSRSYGGLGIGLSLVRHIIELHGGSVSGFSNGPNQGATFTIMLPLLTPQDAELLTTKQ